MDVPEQGRCGACGAALAGGQFCEKCGADQKALAFDRDLARMLHSSPVRSARSSLLWVAILMALGGALRAASGSEAVVLELGVGLVLSAVYLGLWLWARRQPLGATAAGLGIFVTLQVASFAADPATIFHGIIVKVVVLVLLIRGVRAGVMLRSHGARAL